MVGIGIILCSTNGYFIMMMILLKYNIIRSDSFIEQHTFLIKYSKADFFRSISIQTNRNSGKEFLNYKYLSFGELNGMVQGSCCSTTLLNMYVFIQKN